MGSLHITLERILFHSLRSKVLDIYGRFSIWLHVLKYLGWIIIKTINPLCNEQNILGNKGYGL